MLRFDPHVFLLSAGKPAKKNGIVVLARSPFWKYVSEWLFAGERLPGRILPGGDMGSQMYVFRGRPNPRNIVFPLFFLCFTYFSFKSSWIFLGSSWGGVVFLMCFAARADEEEWGS